MREILFKYEVNVKLTTGKPKTVAVEVDIESIEDEMYFDNYLDILINEHLGNGCNCVENCECDSIVESCEIIKRLQFTGITDKNGKKIFEGDEFLCKNGTCKLSNKDDYDFIGEDKKYYKMNPPQKGVVAFDKCSFRGCFDGLMGNPLNCYDELEIIGNKYD